MGKLEDDAIMAGMREAVENFNPGARIPAPKEVFTVWFEEEYEIPRLLGVCASMEVAKVLAENAANKDNFTLEWLIAHRGHTWEFIVAEVGEDRYAIRTEKLHFMIVKDPPLEVPKQRDDLPSSKYGVVCPNCGPQGMTYNEYMRQLSAADSLWKCPGCGDAAEFDEGRYEAGGL